MTMNIEAVNTGVIVEHRRGIFVGWPSYCQLRSSLFFTSSDASKDGDEWALMHFCSRNCCMYCLKRLSEKYVRSCTVSASAISGPTQVPHPDSSSSSSSSSVLPSIRYLLSELPVTACATIHTHRLSRSHRILRCLLHRLKK